MPDTVVPAFSVRRQLPVDRRLTKPLPCLRCPVKAFNVCKPLDYERQKELFELGQQLRWQRRQFLFRAGAPIGPIFKITSGMVAISKPLPDGRRQILDFYLAGEICGHLEADGSYAYDCEAVTDVAACSFNRARFKAFGRCRSALIDRACRGVPFEAGHRLLRTRDPDSAALASHEADGHCRLSRPQARNRKSRVFKAQETRGSRAERR
jgi:CRP-like cAMP-binding protein